MLRSVRHASDIVSVSEAGRLDGPSAPSPVKQRLEEEIVLGHVRPRERLVEEDLAVRFGVKRHLDRAALIELETMGIVSRQPNRGAVVRDFTAEDVRQIYDVRELVEGHAARIMPLPSPRAVIERLETIQEQHGAAVDGGDARGVFRANLAFHRAFFQACGHP